MTKHEDEWREIETNAPAHLNWEEHWLETDSHISKVFTKNGGWMMVVIEIQSGTRANLGISPTLFSAKETVSKYIKRVRYEQH